MSSYTEEDPIFVDSNLFHQKWKDMCNAPIPAMYIEKTEELKNMYSCFKIKPNQHPRGNTKIPRNKDHNDTRGPVVSNDLPAVRHMRPRIGALFTNMEGKARKNFTSFMNKLSPQNKEGILTNFIRSLVVENIHIYIDQIVCLFQVQPTYHDLYMEVLYEIIALSTERATELLNESLMDYIDQHKYTIPKTILENLDELDTSSEQSDQLCEYMQWKKKTKALITFYAHCISNKLYGSDVILERIFLRIAELVNENLTNAAVVDIYLDMALHSMHTIRKYYKNGDEIFKKVLIYCLEWDNLKHELKPSSRFKILDILEIIKKYSFKRV